MKRSEAMEKEFAGLANYAKLKESPHLIRILHTGETTDGLYYTMELADNLGIDSLYVPATLANLLKLRKRLAPDETRILGTAILDGLQTLHAARLIHRDVKPENILYVNNVPKLSDIGLVRSISQTLSLGGTLGYIPPEHVRSGSSCKEQGDDLYALGKVLYCALSGNRVEEFPAFPQELISDKDCRELNRVILTACDPAPFRRFRNADEFQKSLISGISHKKRFATGIHKLRYVIPAITAFLLVIYLLLPHPEAPLKIGEIANRVGFSFELFGGDDNKLKSPMYEDPVYRKYSPFFMDLAPRRKILTLDVQDFLDDFWDTGNSDGFSISNRSLSVGRNGQIRLKNPLNTPYALHFDLECSDSDGEAVFRVSALNHKKQERSSYQWTLRLRSGEVTLLPLEYQPENGGKAWFYPLAQPDNMLKKHRIMMLQTEKFFRLYIDDRLLLHSPSFFFDGYFEIRGDHHNSFKTAVMTDLKLFAIPHDKNCPPNDQYYLPEAVH